MAKPVVVEDGPVPEIFATGALPIHQEPHHSYLTLVLDYPWNGPHGPERHVKVRVVFSPEGLAELARAVVATFSPAELLALAREAETIGRDLAH